MKKLTNHEHRDFFFVGKKVEEEGGKKITNFEHT